MIISKLIIRLVKMNQISKVYGKLFIILLELKKEKMIDVE